MKDQIFKKVHETNKNLIISGDLSIGKTKNVGFNINEKIIEAGESFFVLDSKEEYISNFYNVLKEKNYNIVIINLRNAKQSEGWNFLEYPYQLYQEGDVDKALKYLEQIGMEIFYEDDSSDPFWAKMSTDLFIGIVLGLFENAEKDEINLLSINAIFDNMSKMRDETDYIMEYFKKKNLANDFISSTLAAPIETRESIFSISKQKLRKLVTNDSLNKLLSKTTFDYEDILVKPTAIFFIAKDEEISLNLLASIFVNQLYTVLCDKKLFGKFNFILDNFDSIRNITGLIDVLGSCISRNMKFTIITRSKENLEGKYGNYINKLIDSVEVNTKNIAFNISNETEIIDNTNTCDLKFKDISYPKMINEKIEVFNIIEFINNQRNTD